MKLGYSTIVFGNNPNIEECVNNSLFLDKIFFETTPYHLINFPKKSPLRQKFVERALWLQGVFFGSEVRNFNEDKSSIKKGISLIKSHANLSKFLNGMTIGAPMLRMPKGGSIDGFTKFLHNLDELSEEIDMKFALEPTNIKGDFLNSHHQTINYLEANQFKNIGLQFDMGVAIETEESIESIFDFERCYHFHVANPSHTSIPEKKVLEKYLQLAFHFNLDFLSIEILPMETGESIEVIIQEMEEYIDVVNSCIGR